MEDGHFIRGEERVRRWRCSSCDYQQREEPVYTHREERLRRMAVALYWRGERTVGELSEACGVSTRSVYRWIAKEERNR